MRKGKIKGKENMIKEIELPANSSASLNGQILTIMGEKGEVKKQLKQRNISISIDGNKIVLGANRTTKENKKILGSLTAHVKNMIKGSSENYNYTLKICSGHFPMNVSISGNKIIVKNFLGEKVPRVMHLKEGADVKADGDLIHVTSTSKELAGQVSDDIEQLTRRPGFDTRIFQDGIYLINKDGKELK